jgi:hypothetical protein
MGVSSGCYSLDSQNKYMYGIILSDQNIWFIKKPGTGTGFRKTPGSISTTPKQRKKRKEMYPVAREKEDLRGGREEGNCYLKGELPGDVHAAQLHVHGHNLHGADAAFLHSGQEVVEVSEWAARAPDSQPDHVSHVLRLARA